MEGLDAAILMTGWSGVIRPRATFSTRSSIAPNGKSRHRAESLEGQQMSESAARPI